MTVRNHLSYLHHLEATGGGTLRYLEILSALRSHHVAFLLFDRGEVDLSEWQKRRDTIIVKAPQFLPIRIIVVFYQTVKVIIRLRPDFVHAHSSLSGLVVRLLRAVWPLFRAIAPGAGLRRSAFSVIYTPHCYAFTYPNGTVRNMFYRALENLMCRVPQMNIHVSTTDYTTGQQLSLRNPASIVHTCYDWTKPVVDPEVTFKSRIVLVVGSNRRQKGYEILAQTARQLSAAGSPLRLRILGSERCAGDVECIPWQKNVGDYYTSSLCLLNVSHSEGLSLSVIDALYVGLPVVAIDIPANREIMGDGCGVLVNRRNAGDIASALVSLSKNYERYSMLHLRGRERANRLFSPQRFLGAYADHYLRCGIRVAGSQADACVRNHSPEEGSVVLQP